MSKKIYLLQGIIFQEGYVFGLGYKTRIGFAATSNKAMRFSLFQGVVGSSSIDSSNYFGNMVDKWGESDITNFSMNESENILTFEKHYPNRPLIKYFFDKKEGQTWLGTYKGSDSGSGSAKLIVTESDEGFFIPKN